MIINLKISLNFTPKSVTGLTQVKCCQTGSSIVLKVKDLAREDYEPLTSSDLTKGSSLVMECKGNSYPVKFIQFMG